LLIKVLLELESSKKAIVTKAIPRNNNTNSNNNSNSNIKNNNWYRKRRALFPASVTRPKGKKVLKSVVFNSPSYSR
jgi:hypothetical protein